MKMRAGWLRRVRSSQQTREQPTLEQFMLGQGLSPGSDIGAFKREPCIRTHLHFHFLAIPFVTYPGIYAGWLGRVCGSKEAGEQPEPGARGL